MITTDLAKYENHGYQPGPKWKLFIWYFVNVLFFINPLNPFSVLKVMLLRLFGAKIGKGVIIKPGVHIKYPWFLEMGDHCWIGENVWIDNLAKVTMGSHVCVSQGALILCGNHNYKVDSFDLITKPITMEDGVWIGAQSTVCSGVICHSHSILSVKSVATVKLEAYGIYQGNPAKKARNRDFKL